MPWTYWTGNEIKGRWHAPLGLAMHKWKFTVTIKTKNWEGLNIQAMKVQNPESRHGKGTCYCICRIFKVRHRFCIHCSNFCSGGKTQGSNPKNLRVTLEERCGTVSSERWLEPDGGRYSRAHFELQKTFSYQPRSGYGLLHTTALRSVHQSTFCNCSFEGYYIYPRLLFMLVSKGSCNLPHTLAL